MRLTLTRIAAPAALIMTACTHSGVTNDAPDETLQPSIITETMYPKPEAQPNYGPAYGSLAFIDTDPGETIGGRLTMGRAVDETGARVGEIEEGLTMYMVHWGLEVGAPGVEDDKGAGDHGGDCRAFRDTGYVVMANVEDLGDAAELNWEIPAGTVVPADARYLVGHSIYGKTHNLGKCTQISIVNRID